MMHYPKVTWKMCLSYSSESKECLVKLQNYSQNTSLKYSVQQHFIEYTQRQHGRPERANSKNWVILDANPASVFFFFFFAPQIRVPYCLWVAAMVRIQEIYLSLFKSQGKVSFAKAFILGQIYKRNSSCCNRKRA